LKWSIRWWRFYWIQKKYWSPISSCFHTNCIG
jgi:hypothetical protein